MQSLMPPKYSTSNFKCNKMFHRLTLAMASIVIISLQIRLTSQRCGQKLGLAGIDALFLISLVSIRIRIIQARDIK